MEQPQIDFSKAKIVLSSSDKFYLDHRKCFKQCIKKQGLNDPNLTNQQKYCVKDCLSKFKQMETFLTEKMHKTMIKLILQDPGFKKAYLQQQAKNKQ